MTTESGLVVVDKPAGITSHDVVARVRRLAGTRKVGHAGTLDPMATGVLILGVERATRLLTYLIGCGKRYTATIRLGDKSTKYRKGMVVSVLAGQRFGVREKIFDAVIDKVEVKQLQDLSPREIEHDNPEIRRTNEMANFLGQLYNREVEPDDLVTVIRFSQIMTGPVVPGFREGEIF